MSQVQHHDPTRPASLFKYQPLDLYTLRNLQSQTIYFCAPANFNDPYDCAIAARLKQLLQKDVREVREYLMADAAHDVPAREELQAMGRLRLRHFLNRFLHEFVEKSRLELLETAGLACFSETNSNMLMWSHYADRGRGICLEFDSKFSPFHGTRKVRYVGRFPELDGKRILMHDDFEEFFDLFCTKSENWDYEREWRALHKEAGTRFGYESDALKAIYFGPEVDQVDLNIACLIVTGQNPGVRFFTGAKSESEFKVEFTERTYTPWKDRPDRVPAEPAD